MDEIPVNWEELVARIQRLDPRLVEVAVLQLQNEKLRGVLQAKQQPTHIEQEEDDASIESTENTPAG